MAGLGRFRSVAILVGGLVLFAGLFQIAELLVGPSEPSSQAERPEAWYEPDDPIPIEILRTGDHGYRIKVGGIHSSTIRIDAEEDDGNIDDLVACVNEGIEQARADGILDDRPPRGWLARQAARHRLSEQVSRINSQCFHESLGGDLLLPPLPPPPPPPVDTATGPGPPAGGVRVTPRQGSD